MLLNNQVAVQSFFDEDAAKLKEAYGCVITTKAKNRWVWKTLDRIYRIISFGKSKDFMKRATTVGNVIAFGEDTDLKNVTKFDYRTLHHEGMHVRQCAKLGISEPTFGAIPFLFLYLFVPLPAFRSWFRFKFEREAFLAEYMLAMKFGWEIGIDHFIEALSGPQYLYAWPKEKVRAWFEERTK